MPHYLSRGLRPQGLQAPKVEKVIYIGLGSNLHSPRYGPPLAACKAALEELPGAGVRVLRRARWYRSAPQPPSDQPWFVNGVAEVETTQSAAELLASLHRIEEDFGRRRRVKNEPRVIDLDLLAYGGLVSDPGDLPILPHPRLAERAFVLFPLAELVPAWRHPRSGLSVAAMLARLPPGSLAEPIDQDPPYHRSP